MAKSYHLLSTCAAPPTGGARVAFARSVRTAVDGFVEHEAYVAVAERSSVRAADLADWAPLDVNPVIELLRCAPDPAAVVSRFNAFNAARRSASSRAWTAHGSSAAAATSGAPRSWRSPSAG
ncbi:hypothetical protein [Nocardia sp. NPDC057227]|uniref:hypothetical protein n=1 Tax=Nocardia sp. NPDC057227 TaxID=3346056 RepID=UPI003640751A